MTFLEICQRVCRLAGIANADRAIFSVDNNIGELSRIVGYVQESWEEVQNMYNDAGQNWRWMRRQFTLDTQAGIRQYGYSACRDKETDEPITRWNRWLIQDPDDPPRIYLLAGGIGGEGYLTYLYWDDFKYIYEVGTQNQSYPDQITVDPQENIRVALTPRDVYRITGDYIIGNQELVANDDVPEMPARFHMLLAYMALKKLGIYESAPEMLSNGEHHAMIYAGNLENDQMAMPMMLGEPLA